MSTLKGIRVLLVNQPRTPQKQANLAGVRVRLVAVPSTPGRVSNIRGLSVKLIFRQVLIRVYKLENRQYVPLAGYPVTLTQNEVATTTPLLTDANGLATLLITLTDIVIQLNPNSAPAGHTAQTSYALRAGLLNQVTVVFIPDDIVRRYPLAQVI